MYETLSISGNGFANDETGAWDIGQANRETVEYGSDKYENYVEYHGLDVLLMHIKDRYLINQLQPVMMALLDLVRIINGDFSRQ